MKQCFFFVSVEELHSQLPVSIKAGHGFCFYAVLWLGKILEVFAEIDRTSSLSKSKELPSVAGVRWGVWLSGRALALHSQGPQSEH